MNYFLTKRTALASAITLSLAMSTQIHANDSELLDVLLENGVITQSQHDALKEKYVEKEEAQKQASKQEIKEGVASAVQDDPALSAWSKIEPNADFRFRYETEDRTIAGGRPDRDRLRLRARFGFKYNLSEDTHFGLQLATGDDDPVSTNQTLNDRFSSKGIVLDLAYAQHSFFDGKLTALLGKYKNPYYAPSNIAFDGDLRFEGISLIGNLPLADTGASVFLTGGLHPLDEFSGSEDDPYLIAGQGGVEFGNDYIAATAAVGYFDYEIDPAIDSEFGTNISNDFHGVLNPNLHVAFKGLPVYVGVFGEYLNNLDANDEETGYLIGAELGREKVKNLWDWQVFGFYERIEADATYDEFPNSDFRGGGTNSEGFVVGYSLGLGKGWKHELTYLNAEEIDGPTDERRRLQLDISYKF